MNTWSSIDYFWKEPKSEYVLYRCTYVLQPHVLHIKSLTKPVDSIALTAHTVEILGSFVQKGFSVQNYFHQSVPLASVDITSIALRD